jgi:hypothetical protein
MDPSWDRIEYWIYHIFMGNPGITIRIQAWDHFPMAIKGSLGKFLVETNVKPH